MPRAADTELRGDQLLPGGTQSRGEDQHAQEQQSPVVGYRHPKAPGEGFPEMPFKLQIKR